MELEGVCVRICGVTSATLKAAWPITFSYSTTAIPQIEPLINGHLLSQWISSRMTKRSPTQYVFLFPPIQACHIPLLHLHQSRNANQSKAVIRPKLTILQQNCTVSRGSSSSILRHNSQGLSVSNLGLEQLSYRNDTEEEPKARQNK